MSTPQTVWYVIVALLKDQVERKAVEAIHRKGWRPTEIILADGAGDSIVTGGDFKNLEPVRFRAASLTVLPALL